ncbi:hypothetical protein HGRIS_002211 [Hohenbuehelia grisea]|uniref:AAA+ ATPase domain-containing protein n=1 Tax=Hohenbuehelia grisea TaxID=104357 RepID=A0ABR3JJT3_9AGAR
MPTGSKGASKPKGASTSRLSLRAENASTSISTPVKAKTDAPLAPIFISSTKHKRTESSASASSQSQGQTPAGYFKRATGNATDESPAPKRFKAQGSLGGNQLSSQKAVGSSSTMPLAERLRPRRLEDFVGQEKLTGAGSVLRKAVVSGTIGSLILWGPPGCGKTTLARLLASETNSVLKELSATVVGINDVRAVFEEAKGTMALLKRRTIVFLDEVHRFSRSQQDIFLPAIEKGEIQLIGATTENPSFKLNSALLSRCRVFTLEPLTEEDIKKIILNAVHRLSIAKEGDGPTQEPPPSLATPNCSQSSDALEHGPDADMAGMYPQLTPQIISSIASLANGDARTALSLLELAIDSNDVPETALLASLRNSVSVSYNRTGESHYDMISAMHKSIRGSHGSAAMYWLARMLTGGEDPVFVARRLVVCASEDVGLADNHALPLAMATMQACQNIGMPECRINLAHCVAYLAEAPKSTRSYRAYNRAEVAAKSDTTLPVPMMVRNAPTALMDDLGYGHGYRYNPDYSHPVHNEYLPPQFKDTAFLREEGDKADEKWDEDALKVWEKEVNEGAEWPGRQSRLPT